MARSKFLFAVFVGLVLLALASFASATSPLQGPFKVTLRLSHMPQLNEEVALVCSVTSESDVDRAFVAFGIEDTASVKIMGGQREWHGKFKKNETREFRLIVSFQNEGTFRVYAGAQHIFRSGRTGNVKAVFLKTYKDKPAELLVQKYPKPPPAWILNARINARFDSLKMLIEKRNKISSRVGRRVLERAPRSPEVLDSVIWRLVISYECSSRFAEMSGIP